MQKEIIFSRLEEIKNRLRSAPESLYKRAEIKKDMLKFYADNSEKLEEVTEKQFNAYSFASELCQRCEQAEKESKRKKLEKLVSGLERHQYAPELNKLVFVSGQKIGTPQAQDTKQALNHLIKNSSITKLNSIILNNI